MQLFDVACLPSMRGDGEACPNVVLEYMAMGKAIVATGVGGIPDLAGESETQAAVLVAPGAKGETTHDVLRYNFRSKDDKTNQGEIC